MKCFLLNPTDRVAEFLRRYAGSSQCSVFGYHSVSVYIGDREARPDDACGDKVDHSDPRWPTHCDCGYEFKENDTWQYRVDALYQRSDTLELTTLNKAPVGAMWFAPWMSDIPEMTGPDGNTLMVRLPGKHDWIVDGRASNCDSPCSKCGKPYNAHVVNGLCAPIPKGENYDQEKHYYHDARPHKCWVRHGEAPNIHVDKNGVTCGAGAGSIAVPSYHGFLHNGHLTDC